MLCRPDTESVRRRSGEQVSADEEVNGAFVRATDGAVNFDGDQVHAWQGGHRPVPLLRVVSFLQALLDGAGCLAVGPLDHRHHRALSRRSSSMPRSASHGEPIPTRPSSLGSARVPCAATHFGSPCALADPDDGAAPSWARHCPRLSRSLLSTPI